MTRTTRWRAPRRPIVFRSTGRSHRVRSGWQGAVWRGLRMVLLGLGSALGILAKFALFCAVTALTGGIGGLILLWVLKKDR